jgi:FtsH-binding integral membrane protein
LVGTCASFYDTKVVVTAAVMTAAVTLALTAYAYTTKTDFTYCGVFLFYLGALMFFWGLFGLIFGIWLNALYCVCGVLVYSLYLIYDTQLVMGKFGNEYSIDDYVLAVMMIYIDIIQIFLYLLRLLGKR